MDDRQLQALLEILQHVVHGVQEVGEDHLTCISELLFDVEGKLHEAVRRIEAARDALSRRIQTLSADCEELTEDLGEDLDEDLGKKGTTEWEQCPLAVKVVRLEEHKRGLEGKRTECLAQVRARQSQWLAMALVEGIDLAFEHQCAVKKAQLELERVAHEWPAMVQRAQAERERLQQECRQLCLLLKEEQPGFEALLTGTGKEVRERLLQVRHGLAAKAQHRSDALRECQQVFSDLSVDSVPVDLDDLSEANVSRLVSIKHQTIREHRERITALYAESMVMLKDLLDCLCLAVPREYCIADLCSIDTAALMQIVKRVKHDIEEVKQRAERARSIRVALDERRALIAQMLVFEKTASDPARLFAPSFRLLQEEKFRRSAVPTLKRLEGRLLKELAEYEASEGCEYTLSGACGQRVSLRESLEKEISERFVNEAVFGFHPDSKPVSPRTPQRSRKENLNGNYK